MPPSPAMREAGREPTAPQKRPVDMVASEREALAAARRYLETCEDDYADWALNETGATRTDVSDDLATYRLIGESQYAASDMAARLVRLTAGYRTPSNASRCVPITQPPGAHCAEIAADSLDDYLCFEASRVVTAAVRVAHAQAVFKRASEAKAIAACALEAAA